jgi:Flp pilus assembly pilin Flp
MRNFLKNFFKDESGMGVVEVILIIVGILTTYYGVSIKCIT